MSSDGSTAAASETVDASRAERSSFTLPVILAAARTETSLGGTDWGMLQAGIVVSMIPCILFYLLLQRYYVSGLTSGAVK